MSDEPVTESLSDPVQTWGSLRIVEQIGSGGFGSVYRAWEPTLARDVALKIIRPRDPQPDTLNAILREGQLLARVRHTNVVTIYSAQQIGEEIGLCMEFVRGKSLAQLVKEDGPRAAAEAAVIGVSVCQALAAVHRASVLHRDIKAQNVMREAGGRIVLMDFGAGQLLDGTGFGDAGIVGTLPYMAPEVLGGAKASELSDIYSLGVLLFYLVTGTYPVEGKRTTDYLLAHARSERQSLSDLRPDIAPEFVRVVERATALHPKDRYETPGAMLSDLVAFVRADPGPPPETAPAPPKPKPRSSPWRIPAILALVVLGLWGLGAVTSIAFNHTLGREAAYRDESFLSWPLWGVRALVPPVVNITALFLIWVLARAIVKVVTHASKPAADITGSIRSTRHALARRLGLDDGESAANALLAVEILAVGIFCWHFRDILTGVISFINDASAAELEPLHPRHFRRHQYYHLTMGLVILGMALGTRHLNDMRRRFGGALHSSLVLSFVVLGVALVILVLPYRLLWLSTFETATYASKPCFVLGERESGDPGPSLLMYCPDDPAPKLHKVAPTDPELQRLGQPNDLYCLSLRPCRKEAP